MSLLQWVKWCIIVFASMVTGKSVVRLGKHSYLVAGNVVKKLGG